MELGENEQRGDGQRSNIQNIAVENDDSFYYIVSQCTLKFYRLFVENTTVFVFKVRVTELVLQDVLDIGLR